MKPDKREHQKLTELLKKYGRFSRNQIVGKDPEKDVHLKIQDMPSRNQKNLLLLKEQCLRKAESSRSMLYRGENAKDRPGLFVTTCQNPERF